MAANSLVKKFKLRTHETVLFNEKIFHLNNTDTRYIITGVDPENFQPTMKIIDKASGDLLTISTLETNIVFFDVVELLLNETPPHEGDTVFDVSPVRAPRDMVWKISGKACDGTIILNRGNLENIHHFRHCIRRELYDGNFSQLTYKKMLGEIATEWHYRVHDSGVMLTKSEKYEELYRIIHSAELKDEKIYAAIVYTIITARSYLKTLPMYAEIYNKAEDIEAYRRQ